MFSAASKTDQVSSGGAVYVEDVFSTYLYTGNGASLPISNGIQLGGLPANGTVLQLTGDTLTDSAPVPCGITSSGVSVSTSVKKYGTGSYSYSGASTSNLIATSPDLAVGTGDFTVECWVYATSAVNQGVFQLGSDFTGAGNNIGLAMYPANQFQWGWDASYTGGVGSWPLNTWVYVAIVRQAGVMKLYVNGVKTGADNTYAGNINFGRCWVGNYYDGNQGFNGYIDDFRITNKALYTSNFTPPSQALPLDTLVAGSNYGGLVWIKDRTIGFNHVLTDTLRGTNKWIASDSTTAQITDATQLTSFASTGFSVGSGSRVNGSTYPMVSWTFRKQPKFFDVVTYTGNGANRTIAHNLGSVPGCIIVKRTDTTADWQVYHRSLANTEYLVLNTIAAKATGTTRWNSTTPTSTVFSVGTDATVNANGGTYVAYLFAHDAGGFGLTGTDNVISCGTFTTDGSGNASVNLGYEPQWILTKRTDAAQSWEVCDNMRAMSVTNRAVLYPNLSDAEYVTTSSLNAPTATGFNISGYGASRSFIYIAIRRGPMKTPTSGTSVFQTSAWTGNATSGTRLITGFGYPTDLAIFSDRQNIGGYQNVTYDRLRNTNSTGGLYLVTSSTATEGTNLNSTSYVSAFQQNNGFLLGDVTFNYSGRTYVGWQFGRAPGFMDVVCYTGTGSARTVSHNLGVAPEMMIVKRRDSTGAWSVYSQSLGNTKVTFFDTAATINGFSYWNNTSPTSSAFTVNTNADVNGTGGTYVAYLFASCPGVSKVGSYTGTGATQTISCGFAARFVLIKRTDNSVGNTANWWVWDTARGMVAGTDPRLAFNVTNAESNANWVYTDASGFQIVTTDATVNASGGSYIYLAIA